MAARYRRPQPRLGLGQALTPYVGAMMDVSDGLLIDAARMAAASGVAFDIAIERIPLSPAFVASCGDGRRAIIDAAIAGDDYELLFTIPEDRAGELLELVEDQDIKLTMIGKVVQGAGLRLFEGQEPVPLPASLGWQHGSERS